jgi:hypothetical protein
MSEQIYIIDPATKKPSPVSAVAFNKIGIRERQDLEAWIVAHPDILGEKLLLLTSEFDRFDKSSKRLDCLALDANGKLVVIELKLSLSNTFADQQAVRYAAFCSTMTMDEAVDAFSDYRGLSKDEAIDEIKQFLEVEELPELDSRPRIILAAGSLNDQELTATVLWLRSYGVDITCIELTPYRVDGHKSVILVPRVIIPIPEARDYVVRVERKESKEADENQKVAQNLALWKAVTGEFIALETGFHPAPNLKGPVLQIHIGAAGVHYEWYWRKRSNSVDVCLHFEWPDGLRCKRAIERIKRQESRIRRGISFEFKAGPFGKIWSEARFRIPFDGTLDTAEVAKEAAKTMDLLIKRTYPTVQDILKERNNGAKK